MDRLKLNIVANFAGNGWAALMSLAFVPVYIRFLGIEAYGLIGFYAMLQASFGILDLGLSQTMNRQLARYSVLPEKAGEAREFVRTLEIGYWAIGAVIGVGVLIASPFIANQWIKSVSIPTDTVKQAVITMGLMAAVQWPLSLYEGGLMGLQKQVQANAVKIGMATFSACGAAFILWKVSATITAFFAWQIVVNGLYVMLFALMLWRNLPSSNHATRFNIGVIRNIWRFAAGMSGISLSAVILMQLDKMLLSKLLTLDMFGYYTLAGSVSGIIPFLLVGPVFTAIFPKLTSLVALNDEVGIKLLYHQSTQFMAVLVLPVASLMAFFSFDIVFLLLRTAKTAEVTAPIISVLVVGMALNALMTLPYALQLSHGWTSIGLRINLFLIVALVPAIYFMATHYGPIGAASVWILLNGIYMLIGLPFTHQRLLRGEMWSWFVKDVAPPLAVVLLVTGVARSIITGPMDPFKTIVTLSGILLSSFLSAAFIAPHIRTWLLIQFAKVKFI